MIRLRVLCAVLVLAGVVLAQDWQNGPLQPTDFRFTRLDGEYFPLNYAGGDTGMVYFLGGRMADATTNGSIWRFNPRTGAYTDMGIDMPIAVSNYDIVLLRDNYNLAAGDTYGLYIVGGRMSTGANSDTVQVYYPRSNTTRKLTTDWFPGRDASSRIYSAFNCVAVANKLYLTGGAYLSGTPYSHVGQTWTFDPLAAAGSRWTRILTADLPVPRAYINLCAVDNYIYAMGGDSINQTSYPLNAVTACHRFNTLTPASGWTAVASLPRVNGEARAFGFGASAPYIFQNKVIVAGGDSWPADTNLCHIYDVTGNSWTSFATLDTARRNHAAVIVPGNPGQNGIPAMWVFGGRHLSDANCIGVPEYYNIGIVPDVGVTQVLAPTGTVNIGAVVTPACSVYNYGNTTPTSYNVRMTIAGGYNMTMPVSGHTPGTWRYVTFPDWTASTPGRFAVTSCTELTGDLNPGNDCDYDTVEVAGGDVGVSDISAPAGLIAPGTVVTPRIRITNYTADDATCDAHFVIRDAGNAEVYNQTVTGINVAGNGFTNQNFPTWTANPVGSYTTTAWTVLAGDTDPSNDTATGEFSVNVATAGTWTEVPSPIPLTPSGKQVKDGAWLVEDGGRFYVAKGYKTGDFYYCEAESLVWHELPTWPLGVEAKQPNKGSVGCVGNDGYIYAIKGNNTSGFWRFSYDLMTWEQLSDVPLGLSNKKVKGGTDMVYVRGRGGDSSYIYVLKGYKTEFYRFNVESLTWEVLPDAPIGAKPKWDKGSWLVSRRFGNDSTVIYAHKAKYHEFFTFNDSTLAWSQTSLTGMPFLSTKTGKSKKSKDGGCAVYYDDAIWALKGGNTAEFWRYDVLLGTWDECDTMPQFGSTGKKKRVKAGADIVEYDDVFYALKGNKTGEFWKYTPGVAPLAAAKRSGVMAEKAAGPAGFALGPNPLASGRAALRYSLPAAGPATIRVVDVTGRTVLARSVALGRAGAVDLDLRGLAAGVYLVKFSSRDFAGSQKLVVER